MSKQQLELDLLEAIGEDRNEEEQMFLDITKGNVDYLTFYDWTKRIREQGVVVGGVGEVNQHRPIGAAMSDAELRDALGLED